jgi:Polyketide cyclase / dehydrase and lipid transport
MAQRQPTVAFSRACAAPPEVVYDLLADLRSHLEWAGARQRFGFRLLSLEAPDGPAIVGATFSSTGAIPMSARRWQDHSTVTEAKRPANFAFVTAARAGTGDAATLARYRHRYQISPTAGGCQVTYTLTQEEIVRPMLRLGLPGVRLLTWRIGIPMLAGRGFRNLLVAAAERAKSAQPFARASTSDVAEVG